MNRKGAFLMHRGDWPVSALAAVALAACLFLPGCEDEAPRSRVVEEPPAPKVPRAVMAAANKKKEEEFLAANAKKEGVKLLPSGLQYMVLKEGTGVKHEPQDIVRVHYQGSLIDGTVFDSTLERGQPMFNRANGFIEGWNEVLLLMKEGSKWRIFVPSKLAYGEHGRAPKIGPNEMLIFEIELLQATE
jgi:FKBP-type peptidyl-prolyl cis-trans isomerase FklB